MKMRRYLIPALWLVMGIPAVGVCQNANTPSARSRQAHYLDWSFGKLKADANRLVELTAKLQAGLEDDSGEGMPEELEQRVNALRQRATELQAAVEGSSKNELSLEIVVLAAEIEDEGKALRKDFEVLTSNDRRKLFRNLANKIRKKAASVRKKMRTP